MNFIFLYQPLFCNNSVIIKNPKIMDTNSNLSIDTFKITGNWEEQSKMLKNKFSQLTDSDLKFEVGKEKQLLERIGNRISKKPEDVMNIISKGQTERKHL